MTKYADDTNVSEYIVDHADNSSLQEVTDSMVDWFQRNKFQLNPPKCKEFVVSFKRNQPNFPPIIINGPQIERAEKLSILGLSITRDLKWNEHVDKIVNEASKRIYLLKQLKRFGLDASDLKCFYVASIRSVYLNMHVRYSITVYHKSVGCNRKDSKERATYLLPSTILRGRSRHVRTKDFIRTKGAIYNKFFISILNDEKHKLRNLLPPKVTSKYNFRNNKLFNIPKYRTNRFRDIFKISSLINL